MAGERLETQEAEVHHGEEAQAAEAEHQKVPTVAKRATVASLKKEIDDIRDTKIHDILEWLGELDIRLEEVEKRTATHNEALLGDVKTRLDIVEKGEQKTIIEVADDVAARLEAVEAATGTIADVMRSHIADMATTPPAAAAAAESTRAPVQQIEPVPIGSDTQTIAAKCQTMTDVLMICRALQDDPTLTDADRDRVVNVACQAAGVPITHGLQIRAGVKNTGT